MYVDSANKSFVCFEFVCLILSYSVVMFTRMTEMSLVLFQADTTSY